MVPCLRALDVDHAPWRHSANNKLFKARFSGKLHAKPRWFFFSVGQLATALFANRPAQCSTPFHNLSKIELIEAILISSKQGIDNS